MAGAAGQCLAASLRGGVAERCPATGGGGVSETIPGYEMNQWYGIVAPRHTPAEVIDKLNAEINTALSDPGMKARLSA